MQDGAEVVKVRYEETPYISMPLAEMSQLVDLAYQWAHGVIAV